MWPSKKRQSRKLNRGSYATVVVWASSFRIVGQKQPKTMAVCYTVMRFDGNIYFDKVVPFVRIRLDHRIRGYLIHGVATTYTEQTTFPLSEHF